MAKRIPMTLLAAAGSLAAILPLRGDPRIAPVTHPEWARMLLRAFDVPDAVRATPRASHAFAALSWKTSLAFRGDDFATGDHVEVADAGRVVATAPSGAVSYPLSIVRPGDYRLRILAAGDPGRRHHRGDPAVREAGSGSDVRGHAGGRVRLDRGRDDASRPGRLHGVAAAASGHARRARRGGAALRERGGAARRLACDRHRRVHRPRGHRPAGGRRRVRPAAGGVAHRDRGRPVPERGTADPGDLRGRDLRGPARRPERGARVDHVRRAGAGPLHALRVRAEGRGRPLPHRPLPEGDPLPFDRRSRGRSGGW